MSSPSEGYMFDVRPKRVSLVKRPANKREFLITKNKEDTPMDEVIQVMSETQAENEEALIETLKSADKDAGTVQAAVAVSRILAAFRDSLTESDLDEIAKSLAFKVAEEEVTEEAVEVVEEENTEEEVAEEDVEKEDEVVLETEEEAEAPVVEEQPAVVNEDLEALKAEVEALKSEKELSHFKDLVADLTLTKTPDEIAPILKAVADSAGDEALESLLETLRSASNVSKIAFGEVGSAGPGRIFKGDVWARIDDVAKEIMKSDGVAYHKAVELAVDRNPELGREYYNK